MKKFLLTLILLFLFANTGWCLFISDGTDVGYLDTFIESTSLTENPTGETAWVNTVLAAYNGGNTAIYQIKNEDVSIETVYSNDDGTGFLDDTYAFFFDTSGYPAPDYYLVKTSTYVALFDNVALLDWGVFDANNESELNIGELEISHVTRFTGTSVPEPATMLLFGASLIGLVGLRRRFKK